MLIITVEKGNTKYEQKFPEDKKGEKQTLKFLETVRDSQFSGIHKNELLKLFREKKKEYSWRVGKSQRGALYIKEEAIPTEKLKVSITHDYFDLL